MGSIIVCDKLVPLGTKVTFTADELEASLDSEGGVVIRVESTHAPDHVRLMIVAEEETTDADA